MNISDRLRKERERFGLNQADFGALGGVKKLAQFNYEKGERQPDSAYLAALAAHGVDVLYVLTGQRVPASLLSAAPVACPPPGPVLNTDEAELLADYRESHPRSKRCYGKRRHLRVVI